MPWPTTLTTVASTPPLAPCSSRRSPPATGYWGPEHPDTLASMGNLAVVLEAQGELAAARQLHEQELEVWRRVLGPEHLSPSDESLTSAKTGISPVSFRETATRACDEELLKANGVLATVEHLSSEAGPPASLAVPGRDNGPVISGGRMSTPGVEPRFYTLEDVATILNVRVAQVYALVRSGDLPAVKLGGRGVWRVDRQQLEEYIERMHTQTREWAKAHPLIGSPEAD